MEVQSFELQHSLRNVASVRTFLRLPSGTRDARVLSIPDYRTVMGQGHVIEIFSAGCPLCTCVSDVIEVGKCRGCTQIVHDVRAPSPEVQAKITAYGVNAVPTIVIDREIRITGPPPFPWVCDDDLYRRLRKEYPLRSA